VSLALVLVGVVALAFAIEGALGFGATLVAVTLGAFFVPVDALLPAFLPLNLVLSSAVVLRDRRHVDLRWLTRQALPFMGLGLPFGMLGARWLDPTLLARALGAFVVVLAVMELARRPAPLGRRALLFAGGLVHGALGTGGPLAVAAAGRALPDKSAFRATLAALWLALNAVLVTGFALQGSFGKESLRTSALLSVGLLVGMIAGELLHRRASGAGFRLVVWCGLAAAGAVLALR
jgi:uncharacterized protein